MESIIKEKCSFDILPAKLNQLKDELLQIMLDMMDKYPIVTRLTQELVFQIWNAVCESFVNMSKWSENVEATLVTMKQEGREVDPAAIERYISHFVNGFNGGFNGQSLISITMADD